MKTLKELILERAKELGTNAKIAEYFGVSISTANRWIQPTKPVEPNLAAGEVVYHAVMTEREAEIQDLKEALHEKEKEIANLSAMLHGKPDSPQKDQPETPRRAGMNGFGLNPLSDEEQDAQLAKAGKRVDLVLKPGERIVSPDDIDPTGELRLRKSENEDQSLVNPFGKPIDKNAKTQSRERVLTVDQLPKHDNALPENRAAPMPMELSERALTRDLMILFPAERAIAPQVAVGICARLFDRSRMRLEHNIVFPIQRARNDLTNRFLDSDCEWSFWVDSDMLVPSGDAGWFLGVTGAKKIPPRFAGLHAIDQLRSRAKSLIGGVYSKRKYGGEVLASSSDVIANAKKGPQDRIVPVSWLAAGCMLVHRSVYSDILAKREVIGTGGAKSTARDTWGLFDLDPTPPGYGEDIAFCRKAKEAGHQSYLDLSIFCGHVGNFSFMPEQG
jgi:hypothetical protein